MKISLIGMSGAGKSKTACEISKLGYKLFDCDKLISQKLIKKGLPIREDKFFHDMGVWLGYPWMEGFKDREKLYMEAEELSMLEILEESQKYEDVVIDTTGSVIYCSDKIKDLLRTHSKVIYISVPESDIEHMISYYKQNPRPILWMNFFNPDSSLSNEENLAVCYRELLKERIKLYDKLKTCEISRKQCWQLASEGKLSENLISL
jgi:shikimate kinase